MDRGKSGPGRGGKSKVPQHPAEVYALGSKSGNEAKRTVPVPHAKAGPSHHLSGDRKREAVPASSLLPLKKPKLAHSTALAPGTLVRSSSLTTQDNLDAWEAYALDLDPADFLELISDADRSSDNGKVVGYICGAMKMLKQHRFKPDSTLVQSLIYLGKIKTAFFTSGYVVNALCSVLRRDLSHSFKSKNAQVVPALATNLLMKAFQDIKRWPEAFVKLYIEDALGDRLWVDQDNAKSFVDNILTAFGTKQIALENRPDLADDQDVASHISGPVSCMAKEVQDLIPVFNRFSKNQDAVEAAVLEIVRETLNRRQAPDSITRNFLKLLVSAAGLVEVRVVGAARLEGWLQNPKLLRPAQELLMAICINCTGHTQKDVEAISCLVKIRLKSKAVVNYYLACIRELITAHSDNLATVLKHTIYSELSQSRNPNNLAMLAVMFQYKGDAAAAILADYFQELLMNREDYLRPLRVLLREVWRALRSDLNLPAFSRGLMSQTEPLPRDCEFSQRAFTSTADLITLCMFLAAATFLRPDKKEPQVTPEQIQHTISSIQNDAVWWLQETALQIYNPSKSDFVHALHKVMLMEQPDQYYKLDNWPPETDRIQLMRLSSEAPLQQHILVRVLQMGESKEHPLTAPEALELADKLVKRAAATATTTENTNLLKVDNMEIYPLVFNLAAYHHPVNIDLPLGYSPPILAVSNYYWKAWGLLLVLSAHNPTTVGAEGWAQYPTLRSLMEMCIKDKFVFPQQPNELQMLAMEKEAILQFETHLAAASSKIEITEQTSLLVCQLISFDVKGESRRPPEVVLEQLIALNKLLQLGHLLSACRNPDFLLDISHREGPSTKPKPWLSDIVISANLSFDQLPIECLCEFLLNSHVRQHFKYQQLVFHLQAILIEPSQDPNIVCEILDFFLRRLGTPRNRENAIGFQALKQLLGCPEEDDNVDVSCLLKQLPLLPHFIEARPQIMVALRSACLVETEPGLLVTYLTFLANHSEADLTELTDLVADIATVILERSIILNAIILKTDEPNQGLDAFLTIFYSYLNKVQEPQREAYAWSESQDQVLVTWPSGQQGTLHIFVVHAMVVVLSYGPQCFTQQLEYQYLLDAWFPIDKLASPKAFLVDTSEEALLIPDWLKLRMIHSRVQRLVDAAMTNLEIHQLILFVQSFGIPIASMSKLLEALDRAVLADELSVVEARQDKGYMIQLVEVQHLRGAVGGDLYAQVLAMQEPMIPIVTYDTLSLPTDISVVPKVQPTLQLPEQKVDDVVANLFLADECEFSRDTFLILQKTLSSELSKCKISKEPPRIFKKFIMFLKKRSSADKCFVKAVASRLHISCPLFRLLTAITRADLRSTVLHISRVVLAEAVKIPKARILVSILKNFIRKNELRDTVFLRSSVASEDPKKVFEETPLSRLEQCGRVMLKAHGPQSLVQALSTMLLTNDNRKGLFIDWLVQLEPEIIGTSSDTQLDMLFSRGKFTCRPFLLTLLTHRASWATLHHCTKRLLDPALVYKNDPSAVLDFLIALTCNPKLLQGREKYMPKHGAAEDILELPISQLLCVAVYIVEEAVTQPDPTVAVDKMNLRLSLLAPHADKGTLSPIVNHLNTNATQPGRHGDMWRQLLVQLYLRVPSISAQLNASELTKYLCNTSISVSGSSALDTMSHTLLTALSATPPAKDWWRRAQDFDLATRKLTATHPLLLLRQLKMVSAALRGRVHLEFPVFRSRNHLALFNQILGLLELLKPHLFLAEYTAPLHSIFDTYFALFKQHGHMKDVGVMLSRFVTLLKAYIAHNAEEALKYLQTQASLISELQNQHHSLGSVCIMMSGMRDGGEVLVTVPTPADSYPPQWDNIILGLKGSDVVASLHDLDQVSVRRPALLASMFTDLCELILSPSATVRTLAHNLLCRYLRHNPTSASAALTAYLCCFNSRQYDVITSALDRLPEIIVCSQEVAMPLLESVFSLGLTQNMNVVPSISKSLALLNLQSGC